MSKLLTFNTHSLEEENMALKQKLFADTVSEILPDVIALQEVNQTQATPKVEEIPDTFTPLKENTIFTQDNHALAIANLLAENGTPYYWTWAPFKVGYSKYDEGLALYSKKPILEVKEIPISKTRDYSNYKTRSLLGIRTEDGWYYAVHASWWNDPDEPFKEQWEVIKEKTADEPSVVLMGDFNGDANTPNETYDLITKDGWLDSYKLADQKDEGWTILGNIDGWNGQDLVPTRRIDQIWFKQDQPVASSEVIFNGKNKPILSDHFGVLVETKN